MEKVGVGLSLTRGYEKAKSENSEYRSSVVQNHLNVSTYSIDNIALRYVEPRLHRVENFMTASWRFGDFRCWYVLHKTYHG